MNGFPAAKSMARSLRKALADQRVRITHSESLELVAKQFGYANWNVMAAMTAKAADSVPGWLLHAEPESSLFRICRTYDIDQIESTSEAVPVGSFGAAVRTIAAADFYRGHIRLSAQLRNQSAGLGSLWVRVEDPQASVLRFENLMHRDEGGALRGAHDWARREIQLDVPDEAATISYGFLLCDAGRLSVRNVRIEKV